MCKKDLSFNDKKAQYELGVRCNHKQMSSNRAQGCINTSMLLPRFENTKVTGYTILEVFCFILEHHNLSDRGNLECVQRTVSEMAEELKTMPQKEYLKL